MLGRILIPITLWLLPLFGQAATGNTPLREAPALRRATIGWIDVVGGKLFPAQVGDPGPFVAIGRALGILVSIVSIVFIVRVVQAGIMWMTAEGETEKIETARRILTQSFIALAVLFTTYATIAIIIRFFQRSIAPTETIQYTPSTPLPGTEREPSSYDVFGTPEGWKERWCVMKGPFCRNFGDNVCDDC